MECSECSVRSAVGYCHECEILLCEVCSHACERCGKTVCRSHIQRTSSGRNICVSCVVLHYDKRARQSKERRERRAEEAATGEKKRKSRAPKVENLSFEALAGDLDVTPVYVPEARSSNYQPTTMADREALNARVLTGSQTQRTPTWISGLGLGALAWLLTFAAMQDAEMDIRQRIFNFVAFVVALGTVLWTSSGARSNVPDNNRLWSRIACGVGAGALFVCVVLFIVRAIVG